MGAFQGGVSINTPCKKKNVKYLRIRAGVQRDQYVHDLVMQARILGRRETYEMLMGAAPPEDEFFSKNYETVDHINGNSLDNAPTNLEPVTIVENVRRMNERLKREKEQRKQEMERVKEEVPF